MFSTSNVFCCRLLSQNFLCTFGKSYDLMSDFPSGRNYFTVSCDNLFRLSEVYIILKIFFPFLTHIPSRLPAKITQYSHEELGSCQTIETE